MPKKMTYKNVGFNKDNVFCLKPSIKLIFDVVGAKKPEIKKKKGMSKPNKKPMLEWTATTNIIKIIRICIKPEPCFYTYNNGIRKGPDYTCFIHVVLE